MTETHTSPSRQARRGSSKGRMEMMTFYRVDQVINGKTYEGGEFYRLRWVAEREAEKQEDADRVTGEQRTSYKITEVKV